MTKPAPYPADTRAKGWRFELDMERARQSDTWALADPEIRPWLLMLWATAWEQTPCGSMPSDDALIIARIGIAPKLFAKHRHILLRTWWLADDGRIYHDVLVQRALEMMAKRRSEADRKHAARLKKAEEAKRNPQDVPRDNQGTPTGIPQEGGVTAAGIHPESDTRTSTRTSTSNTNTSVPNGTDTAGAASPEPVDVIFGIGLPLLMSFEVPEKQARAMLGLWRRSPGDAELIAALNACADERPLQPVPWLQARLRPKTAIAAPKNRDSRHAGFAAKDYRQGVLEDGSIA